MKKNLLSAAALVVLFTACGKDDDKITTPETQAPSKYILNIVTDGDSLEFKYNADYTMKTSTYYFRGATETNVNETVYENGKLTKLLLGANGGEKKVTQTFDYNSAGQLIRANFFSGYDGSQAGKDSIVYNNEGRPAVIYIMQIWGDEYRTNNKIHYTWDSKGNIVKSANVYFDLGVETKDTTFTTYTYDDKVNLFAKQAEFFLTEAEDPITGLSANNVTKSIEFDNLTPHYVVTNNNEYTYDEDGYPLTKKEVFVRTNAGAIEYTEEETYKYRYIKK